MSQFVAESHYTKNVSASLNQDVIERRHFPRVDCNVSAFIVLRESIVGCCTIIDISEAGAKLSLESGMWLPAQFHIAFLELGNPRLVLRRWRMDNEMGVQFI